MTTRVEGVATEIPVRDESDGDGKAEMVIWRASEVNRFAKRSSANSVLTRFRGKSGDTPIGRNPRR